MEIDVRVERLPLRAPVRITGYTFIEVPVVVVELRDGGHVGRGEAAGIYYRSEYPERMVHQIEAIKPVLTIALGNGLFLPNLPSQIHGLYEEHDPRRGPAYNLYYAGINLGAFLAPLICGTLGEVYGWHYGFGAAGVGMLLGLIIYVSGAKYLPPDTPRVAVEDRSDRSGNVKRQMILLVSVVLVVVVFRGAYEQLGNTFAIWADTGVDRRITDGLTIPMTWFQSLNPMFVFLLTPVLVIYWTRAGRRGRDPSPLVKMAMGAAVVALAYLMLALLLSVHVGVVSWAWAVLFVLLLTAGELLILPTGLALFGQLAPRRLAATVMALWFLGSFGGNLLAGVLGSLWSAMSTAGFFTVMAATAALAAVLLLAIGRRVAGFPDSSPLGIPQPRRTS
ncbi:MAG TPA: MFS transporter [Steroidobacter sp.]